MTVPSYTEEDVELIAPIVHQDHWWDCDHSGNSGAGCEKDIARDVLAALAAAGRLVPPGSEVREEFIVEIEDDDETMTHYPQSAETGLAYVKRYGGQLSVQRVTATSTSTATPRSRCCTTRCTASASSSTVRSSR